MLRPDLLLLDTPIPDMTVEDLICQLPIQCRHAAVSVVANARDIPQSLEAGVAECLVRPITAPALSVALIRAKARARRALREAGGLRGATKSISQPVHSEPLRPSVLVGEREHRLHLLDPCRVDYIQSDGNYVRFHSDNVEYIARDTVKRLYPVLHPLGFIRIERSLLLNIRAIVYVEPVGQGTFIFALVSGERLRSAPAYRDAILDAIPLRRRASTRSGEQAHRSTEDTGTACPNDSRLSIVSRATAGVTSIPILNPSLRAP